MFVEEAGPQITPICTYGCDGGAGVVLFAAVWVVLIAGALIMPRWRDMFLVALVCFVTFVGGHIAIGFLLFGQIDDVLLKPVIVWIYGPLLLLAGVVHALKRWVLWLAGYRGAPS